MNVNANLLVCASFLEERIEKLMAAAVTQPEEYVPKSIMVTGAAGFIGSHVVDLIVDEMGDTLDRLVVLDILDYCGNEMFLKGAKKKLGDRFVFIKGSILSRDMVTLVLETYGIDTVMHFAAQSHVDNSFGSSLLFNRVNSEGTHNLLECVHKSRAEVRRFIHVSTDEVMGESPPGDDAESFDETAMRNPSNPYSASKAAAEMYCNAYNHSYGLPIIITRGNNVYGPRQYPEKLIPKAVMMIRQGKKVTIHGDGRHLRSFMHVSDTARGFLNVLKYGELGHIYNIGTDFEISNLEVVRAVLREFELEDEDEDNHIEYVRDRAFNDTRYNIVSDKLRSLGPSGWSPRVSFEDGLRDTVRWYKNNGHVFGDISDVLVAHPRYKGIQTV